MSDKPWKKMERSVAALIGGTRFPANQGGAYDCEGPLVAAQVKLLKRMSMAEVSRLAEAAALHPTKLGVVATKIKPGRGYESAIIFSMTADAFAKLHGWALDHLRNAAPPEVTYDLKSTPTSIPLIDCEDV